MALSHKRVYKTMTRTYITINGKID